MAGSLGTFCFVSLHFPHKREGVVDKGMRQNARLALPVKNAAGEGV